MHERESNNECEDVPALPETVADDGDLRGDWLETAEYIADVESRICADWQWQAAEGRGGPPDEDSSRPGFVLVGRRAYIDFVAAVASGIVEHGSAFAAWAQRVGDPAALRRFPEAFLGRWESIEHFARAALDKLGPQPLDEPGKDGQLHLVSEPGELAELLQRRGDINAAADPEGGVFIFRNIPGAASRKTVMTDRGRDD